MLATLLRRLVRLWYSTIMFLCRHTISLTARLGFSRSQTIFCTVIVAIFCTNHTQVFEVFEFPMLFTLSGGCHSVLPLRRVYLFSLTLNNDVKELKGVPQQISVLQYCGCRPSEIQALGNVHFSCIGVWHSTTSAHVSFCSFYLLANHQTFHLWMFALLFRIV